MEQIPNKQNQIAQYEQEKIEDLLINKSFQNHQETLKLLGIDGLSYDKRLEFYVSHASPEVVSFFEKNGEHLRDCELVEIFHRTKQGEDLNVVLQDIVDEWLTHYGPEDELSTELVGFIYQTGVGDYDYKTEIDVNNGQQNMVPVKKMLEK